MTHELTNLWQSLSDPEYLHLLLEPLPLFGLGLGFLFLLGSLLLKQGKAKVMALLVIAASCASVQPYVSLRVKSEPRVLALQDPAYHNLIRQQSERRSTTAWLYYGIGVASLAALVMSRKGGGLLFVIAALLLTFTGFVHALWLHKKECEVYHRNIVKYKPRR